MPRITQLGRVMVPVADQDRAIAFSTEKPGFSLTADVPFGEGDRWVEVAPPGGGATARARAPAGRLSARRMTGVALDSADARADHAELKEKGVDVDDELMGGDGTVPLLFFFRDGDGNHLMLVEPQAQAG
jgi:catechol 2,3-dioxygenase-like lactoylglutathione lyase family enzyme